MVNSVLYESENITLDPLEKEFDKVAVIVGNLHTRVGLRVKYALAKYCQFSRDKSYIIFEPPRGKTN